MKSTIAITIVIFVSILSVYRYISHIPTRYVPQVGQSYVLFLPKFLTHYSCFIPTSPTVLYTYSCNLYCIGNNNVHKTHSDYYTGEQDIASAYRLFFRIYVHDCYLQERLHHRHNL